MRVAVLKGLMLCIQCCMLRWLHGSSFSCVKGLRRQLILSKVTCCTDRVICSVCTFCHHNGGILALLDSRAFVEPKVTSAQDVTLTWMKLVMVQRAGAKACLRIIASLIGSIGSCELLTRQAVSLPIVGQGCCLLKAIMLLMLAVCQLHGEAAMWSCHVFGCASVGVI